MNGQLFCCCYCFISCRFCISQAASQRGQLPMTTEKNLVIVTGPANRLLLTKEILDFCGTLRIYNTEVHPDIDTDFSINKSVNIIKIDLIDIDCIDQSAEIDNWGIPPIKFPSDTF